MKRKIKVVRKHSEIDNVAKVQQSFTNDDLQALSAIFKRAKSHFFEQFPEDKKGLQDIENFQLSLYDKMGFDVQRKVPIRERLRQKNLQNGHQKAR